MERVHPNPLMRIRGSSRAEALSHLVLGCVKACLCPISPLKQVIRQEWTLDSRQIANAPQIDCELHSEQVGFDRRSNRDPVEEVAGTIRAAAESRIRT